MTKELLAEQGLSVDDQGFEELMDRAREVSRAGARGEGGHRVHADHEEVLRFTRGAGFATRFVGYEKTEAETVLARRGARRNGRVLAKLEESPFYPEGGGQVSDTGMVESPSGTRAGGGRLPRGRRPGARARADRRARSAPGEAVRAAVERDTRLATMRNHTATHLLHAALRERLGTHVRQAGSYVGPDKLRFDFTHGERLSDAELADVEAWIADRIAASHPVHALETTRAEAEALGAMALFGEKYGDWVRMVEIDGVSRELCGGTHVANTAELGLFHLLSETSSASNVRRIEAVTGARRRRAVPRAQTGSCATWPPCCACPSRRWCARWSGSASAGEGAAEGAGQGSPTAARPDELAAGAEELGGLKVVVEAVRGTGRQAAARSSRTPCASGSATPRWCSAAAGTAACTWWRTSRRRRWSAGSRAGEVVRAAAQVAGGGGGGRDTMAQAGGRDPEKLPDASATARLEIERALVLMGRVLALDHGAARCGCAVSDPSGTLASVLPAVERPDTRAGLAALVAAGRASRTSSACVVGLPLTLAGEEGAQAAEARAFAERLRAPPAGAGGAPRRTPHHAPGRAQRRARRPRLARRRASAGELPGARLRGPRRVSGRTPAGPGRAARPRSARPPAREREARRVGWRGRAAPPPAPARPALDGPTGSPTRGRPARGPCRPRRLAPALGPAAGARGGRARGGGAVAWFLLSLFQPFKGDGGEPVRVVVPRGSSLEQIAELLEQTRRGVELHLLPAARPARGPQRRAQARRATRCGRT